MKNCAQKDCAGHVAKFDDCMSEALYEQCAGTRGWADEETGNTDWDGYMWLILASSEFEIPMEFWSGSFDMSIPGGTWMTLFVNTSGYVTLTYHDTEQRAQDTFDAFDKAFQEWEWSNEQY